VGGKGRREAKRIKLNDKEVSEDGQGENLLLLGVRQNPSFLVNKDLKIKYTLMVNIMYMRTEAAQNDRYHTKM
jgi:hypothetical protein